MTDFLIALVILMLSVLIAGHTNRKDRAFLQQTVAISCVLSMVLLTFVNMQIPFAGGGDDEEYYVVSLKADSWQEVFDIEAHRESFSQIGYSLFLSLVHKLFGDSLFVQKCFNIFFFLMIGLVWYDIGCVLVSRNLGRSLLLILYFVPSSWFYYLFVLKDILIALLQSIFLWALVKMVSNRLSPSRSLVVIILTMLGLLSLRDGAALCSFATLLVCVVLIGHRFVREQRGWKIVTSMLVIAILFAILLGIPTMAQYLYDIGIARLWTPVASMERIDIERIAQHTEEHTISILGLPKVPSFVVLLLLGEVTAFSIAKMPDFSTAHLWLRGWLEIPWMLLGAPFLFVGLVFLARQWLWRIRYARQHHYTVPSQLNVKFLASHKVWNRIGESKQWLSGFVPIIVFILIYSYAMFFLSATTRWRLSMLPPMFLLTALGLRVSSPKMRIGVLGFWWSMFVGGWIVRYLLPLRLF